MNADLVAGVYEQCEYPLSYVPRMAGDENIVGYTVRVESRWVMDETGEIRLVFEPLRQKGSED